MVVSCQCDGFGETTNHLLYIIVHKQQLLSEYLYNCTKIKYFKDLVRQSVSVTLVSASTPVLGTWNYYSDADADAKMGIEPNLASDADAVEINLNHQKT